MSPASIIYRRRRYDFDESLADGLDLMQAGAIEMAAILACSEPSAVEVNEPLQLGGLPRTALAVGTARILRLLRRRDIRIVTYAIENSGVLDRPPPHRLKGRVRRRLEHALSRFVARSIDSVAFGTYASQLNYASALAVELSTSAKSLIPCLPVACDCAQVEPRRADSVIFVGALVERKGLRTLLAAWPAVVGAHPAATLTIVGKGALESLVSAFTAVNPSCHVLIDPPRRDIHRLLRTSVAVVLLSQPLRGWREQVGLPIVEGLAHGCTVIASGETGLADWLADHGHSILPPDAEPAELSRVILEVLSDARAASAILRDLPSVDGRIQADRWLFEDEPRPSTAP